MAKILLHQCCGPCSIYPIEIMKNQGHVVTTFFYNPNIHPVYEFYQRLNGAITVSEIYNTEIIFDEYYGLELFLKNEFQDKNKRCNFCYDIRIAKSFEFASENDFEAVTTSLLYSKYQNHNLIKELCHFYAKKFKIEFFYYDFREGWKYGIEKSKMDEIYRQHYCGCIFSEQERYQKQLTKNLQNKKVGTV